MMVGVAVFVGKRVAVASASDGYNVSMAERQSRFADCTYWLKSAPSK